MTPEARRLIRDQYLEPKSALDVARELNGRFNTDLFTASKIRAEWESLIEANFVLQQLGERPFYGFPPSDKVELAKAMMVAA